MTDELPGGEKAGSLLKKWVSFAKLFDGTRYSGGGYDLGELDFPRKADLREGRWHGKGILKAIPGTK